MSGWREPGEIREKVLEVLVSGLPRERHFQARSFFQQVIETDRDPENLKLSLPASRRVIETVHPHDIRVLAESLVAFIQQARERAPQTMWAYQDLPDPEADWLADVAGQFVQEWQAEH